MNFFGVRVDSLISIVLLIEMYKQKGTMHNHEEENKLGALESEVVTKLSIVTSNYSEAVGIDSGVLNVETIDYPQAHIKTSSAELLHRKLRERLFK